MSTLIIFLVVIIVLVVAHELGHFFTAKAFGVRVDEFGIGYPPRAGKLFRWKGTQFTVNWLPFGGFVKIFGEDTSTELSKDSFAYQKMWKRVLIIVAGILSNFILAMVLYSASFAIGFLGSSSDFPGSVALGPNQTTIVGVMDKSPASGAGLAIGDVITKLSVGADTVSPASETEVINFIQKHATDSIDIALIRGGSVKDIFVTPKPILEKNAPGIGIGLQEFAPLRLPFFKAVAAGCMATISMAGSIIHTLGSLVASAFQRNGSVLADISGPVGIASVAGQAYALGFGTFLSFVALISVNLAVINLLPFPALDGGRLIIELFTVRGRSKISPRVVNAINQTGFVILILFMLFITYRDIAKLVV